MQRRVEVLKFGGTSVGCATSWQNIRSIIAHKLCRRDSGNSQPLLWIVCSAAAGVSNTLEKFCRQPQELSCEKTLAAVAKPHQQLCQDLQLATDFRTLVATEWTLLEKLLRGIELLNQCSPRVHARVLSQGEILLTRLLHIWLSSQLDANIHWVDPRDLLVTPLQGEDDRSFLSASVDLNKSKRQSQDFHKRHPADVYLTGGFVAANENQETVLLGRGGSDTSAAYIAAVFQADCAEIWTDVPGIFTADPRRLSSARLIRQIEYDEAEELAACGAKILHPRCIAPLKAQEIPLHIKWTQKPNDHGIRIGQSTQATRPVLKAIAVKENVQLISMETMQMVGSVGFLARVFPIFEKHGFSIDLVGTSQSNVTVTLDRENLPYTAHKMQALMDELQQYCRPTHTEGLATIYLVGRKVRKLAAELSNALKVFEQIKVYLISQASSDLNFALTVDSQQLDTLVQTLHELFFTKCADPQIFGSSWKSMFADNTLQDLAPLPWWRKEARRLQQIGEQQTPVYVYSLPQVRQQLRNLQATQVIDKIHFAVKANINPQILRCIAAEGHSFDCVSSAEIDYLRDCIPDLHPSNIVFTPNFAPITEYVKAYELGVWVTVDNLWLLEAYPEVFRGKQLLARLDIGLSGGHHPSVRTGGAQSKFGLSMEQLGPFCNKVHELEGEIIGLHAHIGSGILTADTWSRLAELLQPIAQTIPSVRILNLGGGIGIPDKEGEAAFNIQVFQEALTNFRNAHPQFEIWMEPGRYLVAESGVLLSRFTQSKTKQDKQYIGLDAGMHTLLRPALYAAYHPILNLSQMQQNTPPECVDIVGPICETGDVLGSRRWVQPPNPGDIFLIANTGAYGEVMKQEYNLRTLHPAVTLEDEDIPYTAR
ncbi:MAG: bifunctional aspartate kinase/diaminopimelate decarboxylase [Zetaproteobacteria bacterium]|nr:bifunctional aspartate kinase/diaminopimelate decarboxylase [Zetaproteobacteria bacterium]